MKVVILAIILHLYYVQGKRLPEYLGTEPCHKQDPEFEKCAQEGFEKTLPHMLKGIPEISFPRFEPLVISHFTVDSNLNEGVHMQAQLKNIKITGMKDLVLKAFKADPVGLELALNLSLPNIYAEMEYDVTGQLLAVPMKSKGFFHANASDNTLDIKMSLHKIERNGEEYFKIKNLEVASIIGEGLIKLTPKEPELQFATDLIGNFYNENRRLVLDAVNPIYVSSAAEYFAGMLNKVLSKVPAKEFVAE